MTMPPQNPYSDPGASEEAPNPQRSARKTWTWVIAGGVALIFTGVMLGVVMSQLSPSEENTAAAEEVDQVEEPEQDDPEAGSGSADFTWPANMSTGGIIFTGTGEEPGIDVVRSDAPHEETAPASRDAEEIGEREIIHIYVDYRCPHCANFEAVNNDTLEQVIENGASAVEMHPLSFLDRVDQNDYYSSRAAAAVSCVASEQPGDAWTAHATLADPEFQPAGNGVGHSNEEIISTLDSAVGGLDGATHTCISEERLVPFVQALNEWWFSQPVPGTSDVIVQGTPFAVVNGVPYEGDPADGAAFAAFLETQGIPLE